MDFLDVVGEFGDFLFENNNDLLGNTGQFDWFNSDWSNWGLIWVFWDNLRSGDNSDGVCARFRDLSPFSDLLSELSDLSSKNSSLLLIGVVIASSGSEGSSESSKLILKSSQFSGVLLANLDEWSDDSDEIDRSWSSWS